MNNFKYIQNILAVFVLVVMATACSDKGGFLDVNKDPNNPTSVNAALILPQAQVFSATIMHDNRHINHLGNMMMYNWGESNGFSWYDDEFAYLVTTTFYDDIFDETYLDVLKQYNLLLALGDNHDAYKGIAKIMMAYHFQLLVDIYGNIPYTEALQRSLNPTPKYDDAQTIYDALITDLTDGIALIKVAEANTIAVLPTTDDVMYGGNLTMWKQLANTIKVRILTRESDLTTKKAYITTELATIATEGSGYITTDVQVDPGYKNEVGKMNPYWEQLGFQVSGTAISNYNATCATPFVLDLLTKTSDPRIDRLYELPATGHLGVPQGFEAGEEFAPKFVSNIGAGRLKSATMPSVILTLAEHNLNLAELAFKGFGGDPETLYNAGVTAAFATLGASGAATYLAGVAENVNYASSTNKLEAIITQKWLATNGITAEQSWFDYSRTGFPANLPISLKASTADRPVRLFYPASEVSANATQWEANGVQPNAFTNKIFWAK